jgi:PAS domain S-box-containing protein
MLKTASRLGMLAIAVICGIALTGWLLGIPVLASVVPGWPRMAPVVILCFLLCAGALFELTLTVRHRSPLLARIAAATIVAAIGIYTLIDFVATGALMSGTVGNLNIFGPGLGRPSAASAFNFLLAAIALMLPRTDRGGRVYSALVALGLGVTAFDFVGYAYGIAALSRAPTISTMSLPTMVCFLLLFTAALLARPNAGWPAIIFAHNSGGVAARRLFPTVLALPFILNGIVLLAYHSSPFDVPFGFAVLAVVTSAGMAIATVIIANWLARHDEERHRSQELLQAIADNSLAIIFVKDLAGRYLMTNRAYLDAFHLDRAAVIGKTDYDLFSKYEADSFRAMDQQVARSGQALTGEEIASRPDGYHTFLSLKAPLQDAAGHTYATFGIATDVTDRKRSEQALAASEERTRAIVEMSLDAVISMDRDGAITGWNSQAEKIFGWTRPEALGKPVDETIMPWRFRDAHRRGLARYLATGKAEVLGKRLELTALHRDGREFPVELSITATGSGDAPAFSAFVRDISERKRADIQLKDQLERLALLESITHAVAQRRAGPETFPSVLRILEEQLPADFVCACSFDPAKKEVTVDHLGAGSGPLARALGINTGAVMPADDGSLARCTGGELVYEPGITETSFAFARPFAAQGLRSLVFAPLMAGTEVVGVLVVARQGDDAFSSADREFLGQVGVRMALAVPRT